MPARVAIVGASAAGLTVARALRDGGFAGAISLIGAEPELPYDRPPLSKRRLAGPADLAAVALIDREELDGLDLDLRLGTPAAALDPTRRRLLLADGEELAWDACVLATGAEPIVLPGAAQVLRTFNDSLAVARTLGSVRSIVIIGAGVLGCELAALARSADVGVSVVDRLRGPMIDRLGGSVSGRLETLHRAHGVAFRFECTVTAIEGEGAGGRRVVLSDGSRLEADAVFAAIGCRPSVGWLIGSGVPLQDGVFCDSRCRALPGIHAAGDVARWFSLRYGRHLRIEHRTNASEQGLAVAANLLGRDQPYDPIPFFWTDQYDAKLQVQGLIGEDCACDVLQDDGGSLLVAYSRGGRVEGLFGWNRAKALRQARNLIGSERATVMEALS